MTDAKSEWEFFTRVRRIARRDGPAGAAAYVRGLLDGDQLPPGVSPALAHVEIGEHLNDAGDHAAAGQAYRAALSADGTVEPDARCYFIQWCLEHGDRAEGEQLLAQVRSERSTDPGLYLFVGEMYEHLGDLGSATRWLTAGAMRTLRSDEAPMEDVQDLLLARRRVRLAQGFDEDDYDELAIDMAAAAYEDDDGLYGSDA